MPGATLTLYRLTGTDETALESWSEVASWTTDTTDHKVTVLTNSRYKLVEKEAPYGYEKAADILFTVDANGTVTGENDAVTETGAITMVDVRKTGAVTFKKVDETGAKLDGATFTLSKANELANWHRSGKHL